MKELSTEDKAKRYDEAIERAKGVIEQNPLMEYLKKGIEYIFPELKESEDEGICRKLIAFLRQCRAVYGDGFKQFGLDIDDALAWLEKQGEHAKFRDSIQVGDKVTRNQDGVLVNLSQLNRVAKKDEKQGEQKPAKVEPKFKVGDIMRTLEEAADGFTDGMPVVVSIDDEDYHCTNERIAIKDQDEYEYPPMNRKQESAEWSEEDEKMRAQTIYYIREYQLSDRCRTTADEDMETSDACEEWLKFLRPQSTWKPSKEQLIALRQVISGCSYDIEPLVEIEEQLKKLREE